MRPKSSRRRDMSSRLTTEILSSIFLEYVADIRYEYEGLVNITQIELKARPSGYTPTTDPTNVLRAKALERWEARSSPWSWLKLLYVCRRWHKIAIQCPGLWTWVIPETAPHRVSNPRRKSFEAFIERFITRSGDLPLDIFYRHCPVVWKAGSSHTGTIFRNISAQFARIRSASLHVTSASSLLFELQPQPINGPILQKLELDMREFHGDLRIHQFTAATFPNLRILTIDGGTLALLARLVRPTLTSLTFRSPRKTAPHQLLLRLLQKVPSVRRLELMDVVDELSPDIFPDTDWAFLSPDMPEPPLTVSLPEAEEIYLAHTNLDGERHEKLGLTLLHLLKSLEFPSTTAIFFDPPSQAGELSLFDTNFVASSVCEKVCAAADFSARSVFLDGESGHRYLKFWDSHQSLDAMATGNWTEPARLSFGLWGMAHFEFTGLQFYLGGRFENVTTLSVSMLLDLTSWLSLAEMPNIAELCMSGPCVSCAVRSLITRRTDHPEYPGKEILDEMMSYEWGDEEEEGEEEGNDEEGDEGEGEDEEDESEEDEDEGEDEEDEEEDENEEDEEENELDDFAPRPMDRVVEPEQLYIFPNLTTLVVRHMDADEDMWNGERRTNLFAYFVKALQRRKKVGLEVSVLRLVEASHFGPAHLAKMRNAEVVEDIEWDGKVMNSKGYKLYDADYVPWDTYIGKPGLADILKDFHA